jgi:hypothetical protein
LSNRSWELPTLHGNWVDLYKNHLEIDPKSGLFSPKSCFSDVDERHLGPIAIVVLGAVAPYLQRYFSAIPEAELLVAKMDDLSDRISKVRNFADLSTLHSALTTRNINLYLANDDTPSGPLSLGSLPNRAPFGYVNIQLPSETRGIAPDDQRSDVVRILFAGYGATLGT